MSAGASPGRPPQTRFEAMAARLDAYERLVRLDKPIGILLLLWPTLSALWLAALGTPPWSLVLIFTMGTILMRSESTPSRAEAIWVLAVSWPWPLVWLPR